MYQTASTRTGAITSAQVLAIVSVWIGAHDEGHGRDSSEYLKAGSTHCLTLERHFQPAKPAHRQPTSTVPRRLPSLPNHTLSH